MDEWKKASLIRPLRNNAIYIKLENNENQICWLRIPIYTYVVQVKV